MEDDVPEYDNTNRGALFKNDRKRGERSPDYTGQADLEGVEYWVSAWINEARGSGKKYVSLAFTKKEEPAADTSDPLAGGMPATDPPVPDDDIPF